MVSSNKMTGVVIKEQTSQVGLLYTGQFLESVFVMSPYTS